MEIFIGIDPSINSTGVTVQKYEGDKKLGEDFYIITGNKLTKKQEKASETLLYFNYIKYDKTEIKNAEDNHELEKIKTNNFISICDAIKAIVIKAKNGSDISKVIVVQEGISYGSTLKTKSVFDLAGLNFMIRQALMSKSYVDNFIVATPGEIKKYASGQGNAKKEVMIALFEEIHPEFKAAGIKLDDIADSYFMSNYAKIIFEQDDIFK